MKHVKIGLDIHGVIDKNPEFWINFTSCFYCEVYILTGHPKAKAKQELLDLGLKEGIHYKEIFSITDYLLNTGVSKAYNYTEGNPWFSEKEWNEAKSTFVKLKGIDVIVDDTIKYKDSMSSNVVFLTPVLNK